MMMRTEIGIGTMDSGSEGIEFGLRVRVWDTAQGGGTAGQQVEEGRLEEQGSYGYGDRVGL